MDTRKFNFQSSDLISRMASLRHYLALVLIATVVLNFCGCDSDTPEVSQKESETVAAQDSPDFEVDGPNLSHRELDYVSAESSGETKFEIVEGSGIDFTNILHRENFLKRIETGSGLALGDYDSDGILDVYLVSTDGPNRMYRGVGNFQFEDVTEQLGVDGSIDGKDVWGSGASFADVDNDGDLDLFVCNMAARNLMYINQGNGKFVERGTSSGLSYSGGSKVGTFCDYDRDGDLDLFLLTNQDEELTTAKAKITQVDGKLAVAKGFEEVYGIIDGHIIPAGERDVLYKNDGKGNFTDVGEQAGIEGYDHGLSATWIDFDNDDWLDLYVANDFKGSDKLYKNNRDGTFTDVIGETTNHTPWFSMGSAAGDINNDGFEDIMVADMSGTSHYKQKVNMGNMSDANWFLQYGHPRQYMRNALFVNTGTGRFLESAYMSHVESTDWTWSVKIADMDNDGMEDIFVTNGHARNTMDSDYVNEAKEKQAKLTPEESKEYFLNLPPINESNIALQNKGDLHFESVGDSWNLDLNGVSHGAAFGDFDRDGDLDLIVNNLNKPTTVYRNTTGGGNRLMVELRGKDSNYFGFGSKVEIWSDDRYQMRRLVPVSGYLSSDEPVLHFGIRDWSQVDRLVVTWANGKKQEFKDLQVNRLYRIEEPTTSEQLVSEEPAVKPEFQEVDQNIGIANREPEESYNDYEREPLLPYGLSQLGAGAAWGDVNRDGFPDVFVGGPSVQNGKLYISEEGKRFVEKSGPWEKDFLREDMGCIFFDANGDGWEDLYVVSGSNEFSVETDYYVDRLYLNDGTGDFSAAEPGTLPNLKDSGSSVAAADFDRDGDLDLFVGSRAVPGKYPLPPTSRLLRNDDGKFTDATTQVSESLTDVGMVNSALWTDFDNDGWIDLMLAIDWGPVRVFQNQEGKLVDATDQLGLGKHLGWWHGLAAGDFDNDGDLDYIATNQGLNTKYHCSPDKPHRLYYHDFDENGSIDLVETEFEGDVEFPMRGRSCSSHCMPFIAEKFGTFHEFALADIYDIYEVDDIKAPHLAVNDLRSSVIWNKGEQGFEVEPLPRLAQISPAFGVAVADFNNDGNLDVMLAQNFFGSQPETGYMDGGVSLLLRGDGEGKFQPIWPNVSGIVVPDDALSSTISDFDQDGDMDVLFVSNRGPVRLFENNSDVSDLVSLVVIGPDSNRQAIGAQIQMVSEDQTQIFEVGGSTGYMGNSYFNQTIPASRANSLTSISVRWPDGSDSTFQPTIEDGKIIIRKNENQVSTLQQ